MLQKEQSIYIRYRNEPQAGKVSTSHALGGMREWIFGYIGGIRPDPAQPGFKRFIIKPHVDAGPAWVKADYDSVHGQIFCRWRRTDDILTIKVVVPPNTTAEVWLPTTASAGVTVSGKPLAYTANSKRPLMEKSWGSLENLFR